MSDLPPPPPPGTPPPPPPGIPTPPPGYASVYGAPTTPGVEYAGFWTRLVAAMIDGFVTGLFFIPARLVLQNGPTRLTSCRISDSGDITGFGSGSNGTCLVPTAGTIAAGVLLGLVAIAAAAVYYGKLEGEQGQSLGKRALSIRVADVDSGTPIGFGRGVGRYLFKFISAIVCLLGFLWVLWDPKKQAWHDKVARSVVVKA